MQEHSLEEKVITLADRVGSAAAFRQLTEANDDRFRGPVLNDGREIATERTSIFTTFVRQWAEREHQAFGYDKPFAVVALGGTGRFEMTPCSDNDFAFLFEDSLEDNAFLLHLQSKILYRDRGFSEEFGFRCESLPFTLSDLPNLDGKQLNSFLDMRAVYDPDGLTEIFRERIRAVYDPFEHFLHLREFWKKTWEPASREVERLDRFDIKNQGLRVFLAGVWTLAGEDFQPSWEIYQSDACSAKDLAAYEFLLRIRGFIQLRHPDMAQNVGPGNHPEDVMGFDDFTSFGALLGQTASERERYDYANAVRARLLSARRRIGRFAQGVIQSALKEGRPVHIGSPFVLGQGGLVHRPLDENPPSNEAKSHAALGLMVASQRYGIAVDPVELQSTFLDIGEWLQPVPELAQFFYEERGGLADVFAFLAGTDGAEERLFPGYAKFEASLDGRAVDEQLSLRSAVERQKIRILEKYVADGKQMLSQAVSESTLTDIAKHLNVEVEAALLDSDHLAAVKLALKTKRLPVTDACVERWEDESRPLHERLSTGISGIALEDYFEAYGTECWFSTETLQLTRFLIENHRAFREFAQVGFNPKEQVTRFVELCRSESWLRALYVFTMADQAEWQPAEVQSTLAPEGFNTKELYVKSMAHYHPTQDIGEHLVRAGFTPDHLDVLEELKGVFSGSYRELSHRFLYHLIELSEDPDKGPLVRTIWDGPTNIVGVAAKDYRGLAASITGALTELEIPLLQAHFFSSKRYGLALDFFHVDLPDRSVGSQLATLLNGVIQEKRFIGDAEEAMLTNIHGKVSLRKWDDHGRFQMSIETSDQSTGMIHGLTYRIFRYLEANIFGLTAYTARDTSYISVYHSLPEHLSLEEAQKIAAEKLVIN